MPTEPALRVYTDGACSKDGRGGWAWVLVKDGRTVAGDLGNRRKTTSQKMELTAAIKALEFLIRGEDVLVVSDSSYLVNCFRQRWYDRWQENGWRTAKGAKVKNVEHWQRLLELLAERKAAGGRTSFRHVKGHNGDQFNERADELAVYAKDRLKTA